MHSPYRITTVNIADNMVDESTVFQKINSALFFGLTSFLITVVNKIVLTTYLFPSFLFLGLGQLIASVILLYGAKTLRLIEIPSMSVKAVKDVFPLPLIFIGNMMFGLGGTQSLSLPMFTALRRISIFITLILEIKCLNAKPGWIVHASVYSMIIGAFVAAVDDLTFKLEGYIYVMITNVLTALYQVYIKKKLSSKVMGKYGLMFYNSLFSMIPVIIVTSSVGDFKKILKYDKWDDLWFLSCFLLSCAMGFLLAFSTFLCTFYNSALTAAMVGSIKNVVVTFVGMFVGGDYIFSVLNCVGLVVSALGSVLYTYASFMATGKRENNDMESPPANDVESPPASDVVCHQVITNNVESEGVFNENEVKSKEVTPLSTPSIDESTHM